MKRRKILVKGSCDKVAGRGEDKKNAITVQAVDKREYKGLNRAQLKKETNFRCKC